MSSSNSSSSSSKPSDISQTSGSSKSSGSSYKLNYPNDWKGFVDDEDMQILRNNGIEIENSYEGFIAVGRYAAVFKGTLLKKITTHNDKYEMRINDEIQTHEDVDNENVTQLYTYIKKRANGFKGKAFLVLELADSTFREYQDDHSGANRISEDTAKKITSDLINGLEAIHQAGWCHGDFHANNLLVFKGQSEAGQEAGATAAAGGNSREEVIVKWADFGKSTREWSNDDQRHRNKKLEDLWSLYGLLEEIRLITRLEAASRKQLQELIDLLFEVRDKKEHLNEIYKQIKALKWLQPTRRSVSPSPGLKSPKKLRLE